MKSRLSPLTAALDVCTSPVQAIDCGRDVTHLLEFLLEDGAAHCLFD